MVSNSFTNLTASNRTFLVSKNLKQNMVLNISERWTTFSIAASPDSKWFGSKNSGKPLWVEIKEYLIENFWGLGIWWNFANSFLCTPYWKEKEVPNKYGSRIWNFLEGRVLIDFAIVWNLDLIFNFYLWA
jgi:hypothetical protein